MKQKPKWHITPQGSNWYLKKYNPKTQNALFFFFTSTHRTFLGIGHILDNKAILSTFHFSSVAQSCTTLCEPMNCSTPGLPVHHQLPESTQTHVSWVSNAIQPSHPMPSPSSIAFNLFQHHVFFQWVSSSHQVAKVLEFQLQHQPSNEHPGLISFRMDWLDLLAVQGTLKSLLKHHSSKASILRHSAFFIA